MSEMDKLLLELRAMKQDTPFFNAKTVWEGIAQ